MDLPPPPSAPFTDRPPTSHLVAPLTRPESDWEKPIFKAPDLEPLVPRLPERVFARRPFKPRNRR